MYMLLIFFNLLNIILPSLTPLTIDTKLSSNNIIPVIPIAIPISAFFNAGESLTPSLVTATIPPLTCIADTINNFCLGDVRANTTLSLCNA